MSLYENDRRVTRRQRTLLAIRVLVLVTKRMMGEDERVLTCNGYTHDISETGLALVISARSINETFFDRESCTMQVVLTLPIGSVEITAVPVHYQHVGGETDKDQGMPTEDGFLVGMLITEMSDDARARYREYLQEVLQP
jgi:hypothetical protein